MYHVTVHADLAVIGRNAECADMSNPQGYIYGNVYCLLLVAADGRRLAGPQLVNPERGEQLAAALQRSIDRGWNPETSAAFREFPPVYGSEAYTRGGYEQIEADIERNDYRNYE